MKQLIIWLALLALTLTACGPAGMPIQETKPPLSASPTPRAENTATQPAPTPTASPIPSPTIIPTETPLPPLSLPTPQPDAPAMEVWDGQPTNPADSVPGLYFRVSYDPDIWALTEGQFGMPVLGHRNIPYCVITPASGRGLPMDWRVDHEMRQIGSLFFDVGSAYENGQLRFVTYQGGDGQIFTGFEVSFEENAETCIADANTVISTLVSVPEAEATVTP